jgi:hypothetical protein
MDYNQFIYTSPKHQIILRYPPCIRDDCHFSNNARVIDAFETMINKDFDLYKIIRSLTDHKGTLTIELYSEPTAAQIDIIRWAWSCVGELMENVEIEIFI